MTISSREPIPTLQWFFVVDVGRWREFRRSRLERGLLRLELQETGGDP